MGGVSDADNAHHNTPLSLAEAASESKTPPTYLPAEPFPDHMEHEPTNRRLLWYIVAGLVAWGLLLGLGAYLGLDPQTPDRDYRRLWVVAATTGGFLTLWLGALALRGRK